MRLFENGIVLLAFEDQVPNEDEASDTHTQFITD